MRSLAIIIAVGSLALGAEAQDSADAGRTSCRVTPGGQASPGFGATLGVTLHCPGNRIALGYQFRSGGVRIDYLGSYESLSLHLAAVSTEFQWYYGLGNGTPFNSDSGFRDPYYRERQSYFEINPGWSIDVARHTAVTVGPDVRYWQTSHFGGFIDSTRPYGLGPFGTIGGLLDVRYTTNALAIRIVGRGVPDAWNAQQAYGTLRGTVATRIDLPLADLPPKLAVRVGAEKVWGNAPFQDLAHVSLRGYLPERYAGDASAFANAQLEIPLGRATLFVPLTIGVMAINDVGRVFAPGDQSSAWHDGVGGGLYAEPADRGRVVRVSIVRGSEGTRAYLGYGREF